MLGALMKPVLHVVPHTHWDREWYEPFEGYRFRLVVMVDALLDLLERDPGYHFHFDGQSAAIEDYLGIRPGARERVSDLVRDGRLTVGPWRILMDEFLCSPETIVRNLRQGLSTAHSLGGRPRIGYIPDSFGHIAQMPQILTLAGMDAALAWRGVPMHVDRPLFTWRAPDGSALRTMYLATSYSNAATLPEDVDALVDRASRIIDDMAPLKPDSAVLGMCGSDHLGPQEHLTTLFADANASQEQVELRIGSLQAYLDGQRDDGWPAWDGEMRSSARANVLMGVLSARMSLKQAEFAASTALERYAEPLAAITGFDPGRMLDEAWASMVENSAHDSVCGCGIDPVARDVAARYERAERTATIVAAGCFAMLTARVNVPENGMLLFNPSPYPRGGVVEAVMPLEPHRSIGLGPVQRLDQTEQVVVDMTITGAQLARLVPTIHSRKMGVLYVNAMTMEHNRVDLTLSSVDNPGFDVEVAKRTVEAEASARPRASFRVVGAGPPLVRMLLKAPDVPGLGWTTFAPVDASGHDAGTVYADGTSIGNGLVRIEVSDEGVTSVEHVASGTRFDGLGLVDGGDAGDEYTWSPPRRDTIIEAPSSWEAAATSGPLEAVLTVKQVFKVPVGIDPSRRRRARTRVALPATLRWSLREGEPFARVTVTVDNAANDHRLRLRIPLPFTAAASDADGAFHVTRRALTGESAPHEVNTPTFPSRRWVDVSDGSFGVAVMHRGTPEYEVDADGRAINVTLLRCVGWLSRQDLSTRSGPAGPMLAAPGAQMIGRHECSFALYPHQGAWSSAGVPRIAEMFLYPLQAGAVHSNTGTLPASAAVLAVEPASIVLSSVERRDKAVEVRIYNASDAPSEARVLVGEPLPAMSAQKVDLLSRSLEPLAFNAGAITISLRAWEIATIRLQ